MGSPSSWSCCLSFCGSWSTGSSVAAERPTGDLSASSWARFSPSIPLEFGFPRAHCLPNMTPLWPATVIPSFQVHLLCMRSLDRTATKIFTVTSGNRNLHSKNMVMENSLGLPIAGLGNHRHTCPCLLHGVRWWSNLWLSAAPVGAWKAIFPDMAP